MTYFQTPFSIENFDKSKGKWSRWVERLEGSFEVFEVEETKKLNFLLHYVGPETYDVICDKVSPNKPRDKTYDEIVKLLETHFNPTPLEIVENYKFYLRKQREGESVKDFLVSLRRMAATCNFGDYLETALRNQFVFGLRSKHIQNRCLEKKNLTLEIAEDTAKGMEMSEEGGMVLGNKNENEVKVSKIIHKKKKSNPPNIQKNNTNTQTPSNSEKKNDNSNNKTQKGHNNISCYRCGGPHLANSCRHISTVCAFCKKAGHLKRVCFKLKNSNNDMTNKVEEENVQYVLNIKNLQNVDDELSAEILVNNKKIKFEIDTGSKFTIINEKDFEKYIVDCPIEMSQIKLRSYTGEQLQILGSCDVNVKYLQKKVKLTLVVCKSDKNPLLGRQWIKQLGINLNKIVGLNLNKLDVETYNENNILKHFKNKYPNIFLESLGKVLDFKAKLHFKSNIEPVFIKHRSIPFAIRDSVEEEIQNMVNEGLLEKVDTSDWATPIVPIKKLNNKIRLCGDYKTTINPYLIVDEHPLPTVEELFASMSGGKKFTKIDLTKAYLQLEVDDSCRDYLTLNTHRGLFRPTRLMYGISSAPALFQRFMENLLKDIEGVSVFIDDIKITGRNDEEHFHRLNEVLNRLNKNNMRINVSKSEFYKNNIEYCGYKIDENGIHKTESKVAALEKMPIPIDKDQVRAYVGLVNYYGRFFKNLSTTLYPINNLLKEKVKFNWDGKCQKAFEKIKAEMQSKDFLAHYDTNLPLFLATDASPYGVGAVLSHKFPDDSERAIMYASQTLTPRQQKYSQIDREAYGIIFGVKRFYQFLYGRKFTLITDNKPLAQIFSPKKGIPILSATRMQHYSIYLQAFDYDIIFRKTKEHCNADGISRLPINDESKFTIEDVDLLEMQQIHSLPLTIEDLGKATVNDREVRILIQGLRTGRTVDAKYRFGIDQNEFSLQQNCIMRGVRVYVVSSLRSKVLAELHSSHFGATRMKMLARSYCWWQNIDKDIEEIVSNCRECQSVRPDPSKVRVHCWEKSTAPFQRVHIDFAGPFLGRMFFILVDAYTKWPEIYMVPNITTETTIKVCREIFSRFGIPQIVFSDHGTQLTSNEFQQFLKMNGVYHKKGAPYHPATNGQAERYVQTIKHKLNCVRFSPTNMEQQICQILMDYRKMIHPSTGKSPSMLMFGRDIRSRLDLMLPKINTNEEINEKIRNFEIKDKVAVRDYFDKKSKWKFGKIEKRIGLLHYLIKLDNNIIWKRHLNQIRKVGNLIGENVSQSDYLPEAGRDFGMPDDNIGMSNTSNNDRNEIRAESNDEVFNGKGSGNNDSRGNEIGKGDGNKDGHDNGNNKGRGDGNEYGHGIGDGKGNSSINISSNNEKSINTSEIINRSLTPARRSNRIRRAPNKLNL